MQATKAPCPLCGGLIQIWNAEWYCPACGTLNKDWNIMANCEWCRFGPHFFACPQCKDDFVLWLLMGSYTDSTGRPIHESGRRKKRPAIYRHRLGDLPGGLMGKLEENAKAFYTEDFLRLMASFEFSFPENVKRFVAHTVTVSPDQRLWQHLWLYKNAIPEENEQPVGQLALVYPGGLQESNRDEKSIVCMVNENFW